jgi:hypothetical protein
MFKDEVILLKEQDKITTIYVGQNSAKIKLAPPLDQQYKAHAKSSLERNEPRRVGGTNTRPSVLDRLVTD